MATPEELAAIERMKTNSAGDVAPDEIPDEEFDMDFPRNAENDGEVGSSTAQTLKEEETFSEDADAQLSESELQALMKPGEPATGGEVAADVDGASSQEKPSPDAAAATPADPAAAASAEAKPGAQTEQQPPAPGAPQPAEPGGASESGPSPTETEAPVVVPNEEQIGKVYQEWRRESEELLATQHYGISEDEAAEFDREPAKVVPRLMARVYLDAVTAAIGQLTTHLPQMVRLINEENKKYDASENAFFTRWPQLKGHEEDVRKQGTVFRRMFPQASEEDFINNVGASVMIAKRLDPTADSVKSSKAKQNGHVQVQTPPPAFVPAASAPPASGRVDPASGNVFTQLNKEFEEDVDDF